MLRGRIRVVSDKSLTHRAYLLAALADGVSEIGDPNEGEDCRATLHALEQLGVGVRPAAGGVEILGGRERFREPEQVLDLGNSGTGLRLLAGVLSSFPFLSILSGDASLRGRPMGRIVRPLRDMGARIEARGGDRAPLAVRGGALRGIRHESPVASAQVKSALLLAGLGLDEGEVVVTEPVRSRDHTERLLAWMGLPIDCDGSTVRLRAGGAPRASRWNIPGDVSAATFFVVGAAIAEGSEVTIEEVGLNPTRTGALDVLSRMGASLVIAHAEGDGPEPVGALSVRASELRATEILPAEVPRLVDEIPVLALAAACARGTTWFRGVGELRVKESDRLRTTVDLLRALGAEVTEETDAFAVHGPALLRGGNVAAARDHRIAMTAAIAGLVTVGPVEIEEGDMIATSDPTFSSCLAQLGIER